MRWEAGPGRRFTLCFHGGCRQASAFVGERGDGEEQCNGVLGTGRDDVVECFSSITSQPASVYAYVHALLARQETSDNYSI